jgi:formate hydrogenlyase subunit 3/multisubunit Na+/H+ antiporter MnhD subunit
LTVARVDRDIRRIVAITAVTGGGSLLLGLGLIPALGEAGVALGYLVAHTAVAIPLTLEWLIRGQARP